MPPLQPDSWQPAGVRELEPEALRAIREVERSVLVTAGPGAGKTEFLAQKALYLLQTGICPAPQRILAISFKRDAASNLAERVERRGGRELARRFDTLTFDAFTKGMVDRFRLALPEEWRPGPDYRIVFPKRGDFEAFLESRRRISLNASDLERLIATTRLPVNPGAPHAATVRALWRQQLEHEGGALLSFGMINRLVLLLLDRNPRILRALRLTYPFVLLDEFQDTTDPQFELLCAMFRNTRSRLTAVGDDLQRIMGWAGAMPDGFERFDRAFGAERITLSWNWRVPPELARIQANVANEVLGRTRETVGRAERTVEGEAVAIWGYPDQNTEAQALAHWLKEEIARGSLRPEDVAILVRQKADEVERQLRPAFEASELQLRNVARQVGDIAIQDLLAEPLTAYLLSILELAARKRAPEARAGTLARLAALEGLEADDEVGHRRFAYRLDVEVKALRRDLQQKSPGDRDALTSEALVGLLETVFGEARLRGVHPSYRRDEDFLRVRDGLTKLLDECRSNAATWDEVIECVLGKGQISLMTIHKAKGLEFHTVVFYGLDAQEWRSLNKKQDEEKRAFYVALSRARQRAIFTRSEGPGAPIGWLETILQRAGVSVRRPATCPKPS